MATLATDISITRQWLDLSLAQRAVWLDATLSNSPTAYTLVRWARLRGEIDAELAHQALTLIVARHDALRLRVDRELPRQWMHPSPDAPFSLIDLSREADPGQALQAHLKRTLATEMPLGEHWLFSLELVKLGSREFYLLTRCHHLLADEAAVSMILAHLLEAYRALSSDSSTELTPPSSYLAVIDSDVSYTESARYKQDLDYWVGRLKSLSPPLFESRVEDSPPLEAPPVACDFLIEGELYAALLASCTRAGVMPQRAIFSLFAVLLGRRYSQSDVTIGMALHRRDISNLHVVGMLAGMLAVRCQLRAATLLDMIRAISAQVDRDLRHQRLPIDALSRELGVSHGGLSEMFQVAFSFLPPYRGALDIKLDGIDIELGGIPSREASPITIHVSEAASGGGILVGISAHPAFLEVDEVNRLIRLFEVYVEQLINDPHIEAESLPGITPAERLQVVSEWNATTVSYPIGRAEHFFQQQVIQIPEAVAVVSAVASLTYAELDARSNQLAHLLAARGLVPQSVVGVALERSVETIVSLLAILKAGCIYLPLDPSYPPDRLAHMLSDSAARLVITNPATSEVLPANVQTMLIDQSDSWTGQAELAPAETHSAGDAAYIIYTSGSTGKPKGVAVPHSAAVNLAFGRLRHDPISAGDRILAAISVGFDVSIGQLLLPLLSGATIVIASDLRTLTPQEFWNFLQSHRVTHINSVPSFFESILDAAPKSTSLVRLMLGGEPLSSSLVRRLQEALPQTQILNMYGPTEACIDATFYAATRFESAAVLPIGKPLPNYRAYIVNEYLDPAGIGIAGDLYLGGVGLAHAYINQPALTAEGFIADPFGAVGERLYKTGDRARWRSDGNIDFLGRADTQVKIRGHRIELGEIEAALLLHPDIAQAAVIANTDKPDNPRLVAYLVLHAVTASSETAQLRSHLANHIPGYMIPAAFCMLSALPLTANGKLDQRALPAVDWQSERTYLPPETETEMYVAQVFAELLEARRIGATDNFFELGGHSLLATRLVSQLRSRFGVSIPLRTVFETPTVEAIARYIDRGQQSLDVFAPLPRPEFIPLSFTQERLWFLSQLQKDDTYNVPVAISLRGRLDTDKASAAITEIVRRHEVLRTILVMHDGRPIQRVQALDAFQVQTIQVTDVEAAHRRLRDLVRLCFDLACDLPIKAEIISISSDHHVLAAVVHHAAFDGWSANAFFHEFGQLNSAESLTPLPIQYADFAVWQRQQEFSHDLSYWKDKLTGTPPVLDFPAFHSPSELSRRPAGIVPIDLDVNLHRALLSLANATGTSLFMVLHAAFAILLARWSGQNDLVIGTVVANRTHAEFEPLIGCFVNTLALRTRLQRSKTFLQLLGAIKEDDLAAYEHQAVPFEKLVDELQPERSLYQTPIVQVMLVLQNEPLNEVHLPGLTILPWPLEPGIAKFNLTLNLGQRRTGGALAGSLEYASDLYDSLSMQRFANQFQRLLKLIVADPKQLPTQADLLDPADRLQVISEWNATAAAYPKGRAERFFQQQALQTPEAVAVLSPSKALTYAQLDIRSNQLAHLLVARGLRPQSVIGVALERSLDTVVSMLAILKAGCAYLPLDPSYPPDRLAHMLADSHARLVIGRLSISDSLPANLEKIFVDQPDLWNCQPEPALAGSYSDSDAAYIIYTSGSTGKPKGVSVPHSAAVNLAFGRLKHDPISTGDRILAAISVGFDVSIGQLLLPLLSGATIVIAPDLRTLTPPEFWEFLQVYRVSHINSVPSFFESILDAAPKSASLVRLMLGGEPLSSTLVRRLRKALPQTQVLNMYGPTEACIDATFYAATSLESAAVLPIGKPLPNYRAYILNEYLDAVGTDITGDLYLAGAGLAHAYINQPALTAESFIADPFSELGERLYKTGDRARWRPDGDIEFLGRADSQVKIRGHRIELGEIEAALLQQSGLREVAVIVREDTPADQRLVAYYTADRQLSADSLRGALSLILPAYMVPAAFVYLDSLPLTANGKLNRSVLPIPGAEAYAIRRFEPPQGIAERQIAAIFATALKVNQVGRHDNFFELGGHSLLAMTVIELMRQAGLHAEVRHLFTSPTVSGLAKVLVPSLEQVVVPPNLIPPGATKITPDLLSLVTLSQTETDALTLNIPGGAANIQDIYPLAPLQEGILFHHLMSKTGDAYLTPFIFSFDTHQRLELFLNALRELVARHDILRTAVIWENVVEPLQVVLRNADLPVEEVEVAGNCDVAMHLRQKYDPQHFRIDVRQAPMMRAYISQDTANDRWLMLVMSHHLILDHTSMEVILQEVGLISSGKRSALPEATPFRNFVAQARLGISPQEHEEFFRKTLGDVDETTAPYGLLRVQGCGEGIRESTITIHSVLANRLRLRVRQLGVGPAALFHLAWALVLAHVSGRRDVVFGTLLLGRLQSGGGSRASLGLFINTLPLRIRIDSATVEHAVRRTHEQLAELIRHENASLTLAQRCSGVAAPTPLFSSLFNFRQSPAASSAGRPVLPGVELVFGQERTDYPVAVAIDDRTDDFLITAQADAPVDPADLCGYMETSLTELLLALENKPSTLLHRIPILPAAQHRNVISLPNQTTASYPFANLSHLFEQQAAKTPAAIAIQSATESLTYAALNHQAEQLANVMVARGVFAQTVVGVALPRSASTVVSLLAILKLGAIYLPLDPAYPSDRLGYMMTDSRASLVIVNGETQSLVPAGIKHLNFDSQESAPPRQRVAVGSNYVAYVIYTSGSTGKPKGVAVPHSAAVNLAFARQLHDPITTGSRILAAISVGFDVSIGQLLLPLLSGATIVIVGDLRTLTPKAFWEFLEIHQVTHINSVPSFFESILVAAPNSTTLSRLMLGGEPLSSALVKRLRKALPQTQLFNMYGPTEACIDATSYEANGSELTAALPIGKPLPNYRTYILNDFLDPVGPGVEGDLYLAGAGLAHAYIYQPALTAERFIADPFSDRGERLYRTGDRACWRPDGNIDFLGRADTQVKIRGHRIELGEIEAALLGRPGLQEAAVIVREDTPGDQRLVAYYTAGQPLSTDLLRSALSQTLPAYMLPAAYLKLESFPLTSNGKLNRNALPVPGCDAYAIRRFEPPQGMAEQQIADIFSAVLKVSPVGRHDNFFELGGHSLLAMSVIEQMRQASLHVDVRRLFTSPTVSGLANALAFTSKQVAIPPNIIPLGSTAITPEMLPLVTLSQTEIDAIAANISGGVSNIQDIYPLAPLQEGILFHHLMSKAGDAYLTPFIFGFDRRQRLESFLDVLRELVARHDILRTAVLWEHVAQPLQVVLRDAVLPIEEVEMAATSDIAIQLREKYDPRHFRLDVRQAPMMRVYISQDLANNRWLLLVMSHHLILDHTSMEVILHEVGLISSGQRKALPEPTPFRNFVAQTCLGISKQEHEEFFRKLLGDVNETTSPYGLLQVQADGAGIRESKVPIDSSLAARLRSRARELGVGPATLFHLAWALVLAHVSGRRDVVFGTLLLGRLQSGGSSQASLGLFINTLPLRIRIDSAGVEQAVRRTHEQLAELIRHENASLTLAQRCSGVPAPAPLFSSLFNFRQSPPASSGANAALPGVELVFSQERTDYPVAVAVDDRTEDFLITAQADSPVDPADLCGYMQTAVVELLSALENAPLTPVHQIGVLSAEKHLQVIESPNRSTTTYPSGTIHQIFESQVVRTPAAIAVASSIDSLTYTELNERAEHLANLLASRGVTSQTVVGVLLIRSVATVVSALAILKLGAIYLPLDPAYPPERLAYMIADSRCNIVIANNAAESLIPTTVQRLNLDSSETSATRIDSSVDPIHTAYIIYTSGSTGKPKGVAVPHSAAVNLAFARHQHDPITTGDRILAAISVGFDVSIGQLLLPLLSGATVVIASDLRTLAPQQFWEFLQTHRVTHINSVPSFFESILDAAPHSTTLVRLMLGGEPLTPALVRRLEQSLPQTQLVNMYGPTEACIDATCYPLSQVETGPVLPIGKPLPNYRAYILNDGLNPVGVNVEGDLFLAGSGLASAYINQPALTAERFIADPFSRQTERMYKTGDRARRRSDGNIEFLGRADTQVKIRGHRIELGEIESALLLYPSIAQVVVVADTKHPAAVRLVAYVVFKSAAKPADQQLLRAHLALNLPEYMIPAVFVSLEALPLTPNGKVDVKALPGATLERAREVAYEAPSTQTEIAMEKIWRQVLEVERIGIHENFFSLGGHSLAVMRLISLCNSQVKTNLALRSLFDNPTISKISNAIDTNSRSTAHPSLVSLRASGTRTPLFCIHPAGGAVLRYVPLTNALNADQPVYGLQARALLEGEPLGASLEEMAADYVSAIRSVQPTGPYQLLGWSSGGMLGYEMAQQLSRVGETVSFLGLLDTSLPENSRKNPSERDLMHAFASTFGYEELFSNPRLPASSAEFQERIVAANRMPPGIDVPQFRRFYAVFRNTLTIYPNYIPVPWSGSFTLFRALKQASPVQAWPALVSPNATYIDMDCTHADLPSEAVAPVLAKHIESLLN